VPPGTRRYLNIAAELRARVEAGEWPPGSTLPRMADLAREYGVNRDTLARAIAILEGEGLVWAVPRRGTVVRHGMSRPRRPRGNLVKRNVGTDQPGYSFPSASGQEVWTHRVPRTAKLEPLADPRLARMLGVPEGTAVMHRHRVTGPASEPPFQTNDSWIHPRGTADVPEVAEAAEAPGDWLYRLERAGHGPISWRETHRARMPTSEEAVLLQIPVTLPVLEIVRVGTSAKDRMPIEVTQYVIPADRVEQVVVLERDESAAWPWPDEPGRLTRSHRGGGRAQHHRLIRLIRGRGAAHVDDDHGNVVRSASGLGEGDELADGFAGTARTRQGVTDRRSAHDRAQAIGADQVTVAGAQVAQAEIR
jgi:DNA-binding GntR family transcriptional regulator